MRNFSKPGTRAAILALPLLLLLPPAPLPAQTLPPAAGAAVSIAEPVDPPTEVGRIARISGQVSYRLPGEEQWQPASRNLPVIEGNAVYAAPGGRALIEIGQSRVALEGGTDLQFAALNDTGVSATLPHGAAYVMLSGLAAGEAAQIVTPQAGVTMLEAGRYLFEVPESGPSRVAVLQGEALLATPGGEMRLTSGQAAIFAEGGPPRIERAGPGAPIVAWADGALPQPRQALPPATAGMTGITELAGHGRWAQAPDYGEVWYPNVAAGWAPYRDGTWQWVEPWGWTWVDAQPWGYAPSHYGRWVQVGPRWAWAPLLAAAVGALAPRPVWTPANVRFFGGGYDRSNRAPVGWVPLAPREAYYPWYRASPRYVERVNARHVTNLRDVSDLWARGRDGRDFRPGERLDQFRNRRFATVVPAEALQRSRPVRQEMGRVRAEDWRRTFAQEDGPPRPGAGTAGLTPMAARRLGIAPDAVRASPVRAGPSAEPHVALQQRLPEQMRGRPEARRGPEGDPRGAVRDAAVPGAGVGPDRQRDAAQAPRRAEEGPQRQAIEQQRRMMEEHQRRAAAERRDAGQPPRVGAGDTPRAPAAETVDRARRGAEEPPRRVADPRQREELEQQRSAAGQRQRDAADQQRRAVEQRQRVEQQRRVDEQQQRDDAQQQRRAAERQQRDGAEQRRQAVEQQHRAVEQQQRQAIEQQRHAAEQQQQRQVVEQQRRAAEQQQRQAVEQQRRAAEQQQQRQAVEQQRRAVEQQQRQAIEQQRHAAEQQQRQAVEQQRRAAEQQQRQAVEQQRRSAGQQQRQAAEQQNRAAEQQQRREQQRQVERRRNNQPD